MHASKIWCDEKSWKIWQNKVELNCHSLATECVYDHGAVDMIACCVYPWLLATTMWHRTRPVCPGGLTVSTHVTRRPVFLQSVPSCRKSNPPVSRSWRGRLNSSRRANRRGQKCWIWRKKIRCFKISLKHVLKIKKSWWTSWLLRSSASTSTYAVHECLDLQLQYLYFVRVYSSQTSSDRIHIYHQRIDIAIQDTNLIIFCLSHSYISEFSLIMENDALC